MRFCAVMLLLQISFRSTLSSSPFPYPIPTHLLPLAIPFPYLLSTHPLSSPSTLPFLPLPGFCPLSSPPPLPPCSGLLHLLSDLMHLALHVSVSTLLLSLYPLFHCPFGPLYCTYSFLSSSSSAFSPFPNALSLSSPSPLSYSSPIPPPLSSASVPSTPPSASPPSVSFRLSSDLFHPSLPPFVSLSPSIPMPTLS